MLYASIKQLFPNAIAGIDFILLDDGEGPFIAQWNLTDPIPTAADLAVARHAAVLKQLSADIDSMADEARQSVAGDALRALEYEKAAEEAQQFKTAGYPDNAIPRTVAAWAIGGRSAQQAADNILSEAAAYNEALYQIRELRLDGKVQVQQAMAAKHEEQARTLATNCVDRIRRCIAGIGNART